MYTQSLSLSSAVGELLDLGLPASAATRAMQLFEEFARAAVAPLLPKAAKLDRKMQQDADRAQRARDKRAADHGTDSGTRHATAPSSKTDPFLKETRLGGGRIARPKPVHDFNWLRQNMDTEDSRKAWVEHGYPAVGFSVEVDWVIGTYLTRDNVGISDGRMIEMWTTGEWFRNINTIERIAKRAPAPEGEEPKIPAPAFDATFELICRDRLLDPETMEQTIWVKLCKKRKPQTRAEWIADWIAWCDRQKGYERKDAAEGRSTQVVTNFTMDMIARNAWQEQSYEQSDFAASSHDFNFGSAGCGPSVLDLCIQASSA